MPLSANEMTEIKDLVRTANNEQRNEISEFIRNLGRSSVAKRDLHVGDKCRISGIKPKYMNGTTCTITDINLTRAVVTLDEVYRGRTNLSGVTIPLACLTKVA